jgi:Tol biopolymer transport system component
LPAAGAAIGAAQSQTMMSRRSLAIAALAAFPASLPAQQLFVSPIERVPTTVSGASLDAPATHTRISDDGRRLVFATTATNVGVGTPAANRLDLYLRDLQTGQITVVGIGIGNGLNLAEQLHMSADGRFVLFHGSAANHPTLTSPEQQVFVRDTFTGALEVVTRNAAGGFANGQQCSALGISADGRYATFVSSATDLPGGNTIGLSLYRLDRQTGSLQNVIVATDGTPRTATFGTGSINADGRYVCFSSLHADLVPGDTNARADLFLRDMVTGSTERVSVGSGGMQGIGNSQRPGSISADGRFVVFSSFSPDLAQTPFLPPQGAVFLVRDRVLDTTRFLAVSPFGAPAVSDASIDFVPPRFIDSTRRVVFATRVALRSPAPPSFAVAQVYAVDIDTGDLTVVSNRDGFDGDLQSLLPSVSWNGRHLVFVSAATNLVPSAPASNFVPQVMRIEILCAATLQRIGVGSPASGDIVPLMFGNSAGCDSPLTALAGGLLGGSPLFLMVGGQALVPSSVFGPTVYVDMAQPFSLFAVPNGGVPGLPGAGSWFGQFSFSGANNFTMLQLFSLDPAGINGIAATNGLLLEIQ